MVRYRIDKKKIFYAGIGILMISSSLSGAPRDWNAHSEHCGMFFRQVEFNEAIFALKDRQFKKKINQNNDDQVKIEIGAASKPLCPDCVHLNIFKKHLLATKSTIGQDLFTGVIVSAADLPFKDGIVHQIVARNLPILAPIGPDRASLRLMLSEFKRVLANEGEVFLMTSLTGGDSLHGVYTYQLDKTQPFGYKITTMDYLPPREAFLARYRHIIFDASKSGFDVMPLMTESMIGLRLRVKKSPR